MLKTTEKSPPLPVFRSQFADFQKPELVLYPGLKVAERQLTVMSRKENPRPYIILSRKI